MSKIDIISNQNPNQGSTPLKYNGGQLYKKEQKLSKSYLFTVDKFIVNCYYGDQGALMYFDPEDPADTYEHEDVLVVKDTSTGNGTRRYRYGYDVSFNGQSIGLLLIAPRQGIKGDLSCSFTAHNHILYQKAWTMIIELAFEQLGIGIKNMTQVDIACDGHGFVDDYKRLLSQEFVNVGRSSHRPAEIRKGDVKGFYIGKKTSDKHMCGYIKSNEIKISNKNYIKDYWVHNNLKDIDTVERLELRLKNKAIKTIRGFDFRLLEDPIYLVGIFRSQTVGYYEFVLKSDLEKDKNISRAKKIPIIDWSQLEEFEMEKIKRIKKPSSIWGIKRYITTGLQLIEAGYYPSKTLFYNPEYQRLRAIAEEYEVLKWMEDLTARIAKRDKSLIAEMRYNRMEIEAGNKGIYDVSH